MKKTSTVRVNGKMIFKGHKLTIGVDLGDRTGDLLQMRDKARMACQRQLEELTLRHDPNAIKPEFLVQFGIPSEQILLRFPPFSSPIARIYIKKR